MKKPRGVLPPGPLHGFTLTLTTPPLRHPGISMPIRDAVSFIRNPPHLWGVQGRGLDSSSPTVIRVAARITATHVYLAGMMLSPAGFSLRSLSTHLRVGLLTEVLSTP